MTSETSMDYLASKSTMSSFDDNYYIQKVLKGDRSAFTALVERYQDFVYHIAFKIVRNREEAEEVAQDSFIKAFTKLDTFRQQARFSSWLYKICYYTAISKTRNLFDKIHIFGTDIANGNAVTDDHDGLELLNREEMKKYIGLAMEQLPGPVQVILSLFYLEEHNLHEISDITGYSESNIKSILHRGRKKLAEQLIRLLNKELPSLI